jgi:hypothetical protein
MGYRVVNFFNADRKDGISGDLENRTTIEKFKGTGGSLKQKAFSYPVSGRIILTYPSNFFLNLIIQDTKTAKRPGQ